MGADIKSLRLRIRSVDSTLHLTKAMGLVASSKMKRAFSSMQNANSYANAVTETAKILSNCPECNKNPYMFSNGDRVCLIVIAGDRGLCAGYNSDVFKKAHEYPDAQIIPIGKLSVEKFGGNGYISSEHFTRQDGYALAKKLCSDFLENKYDRLGIVSGKYISLLSRETEITWVLPLEKDDKVKAAGILFEPNPDEIMNTAVTEYVSGIITARVREGFACEIAARRTAMDSAEKNAQQMISDLELEYNRARQSEITQEITEIVAGSGG